MGIQSMSVGFWVVVGLMVLAVALLGSFLASLYRKAGPHEALIVYGFRGTRIVKGHGTVIFPMVESFHQLSLELMSFDVERHQLERELMERLDHREDDRPVALHDARPAEAVDDQRFMGTRFPVQRCEEGSQQRHRQHHQSDDDPEPDAHTLNPHDAVASCCAGLNACATYAPRDRCSASPTRCRGRS